MFERLDAVKPALQKLIAALRERFAYASVLATDERYRMWRVSKNGISITSEGDGGYGFVIRVFDETGCAEYSINAFSEELIPAIVKEMQARLEAERAALPEGVTPLPTAIPDDSPAVLKKEAQFEIDPAALGDEAILERIARIREKGMQAEHVLDVSCNVTYCAERKLFLSEHRDLDETHMWTTAGVGAFGARGEELKNSYKG